MTGTRNKDSFFLFIGDIIFWSLALWLAITIRNFEIQPFWYLKLHIYPFAFIFAIWVLVFFISDLYSKQIVIFKNKLPAMLHLLPQTFTHWGLSSMRCSPAACHSMPIPQPNWHACIAKPLPHPHGSSIRRLPPLWNKSCLKCWPKNPQHVTGPPTNLGVF